MSKKTFKINESSVPVKAGDLIVRGIEGETVILDLGTGIYYGLNETGGKVWGLIDGSRTARGIANEIAEEFALSGGQALEDTIEVLGDLSEAGLINSGNSGGAQQDV